MKVQVIALLMIQWSCKILANSLSATVLKSYTDPGFYVFTFPKIFQNGTYTLTVAGAGGAASNCGGGKTAGGTGGSVQIVFTADEIPLYIASSTNNTYSIGVMVGSGGICGSRTAQIGGGGFNPVDNTDAPGGGASAIYQFVKNGVALFPNTNPTVNEIMKNALIVAGGGGGGSCFCGNGQVNGGNGGQTTSQTDPVWNGVGKCCDKTESKNFPTPPKGATTSSPGAAGGTGAMMCGLNPATNGDTGGQGLGGSPGEKQVTENIGQPGSYSGGGGGGYHGGGGGSGTPGGGGSSYVTTAWTAKKGNKKLNNGNKINYSLSTLGAQFNCDEPPVSGSVSIQYVQYAPA